MESIILIGNENFDIKSITTVSYKKATKSYFSIDTRYVVEYEDGHVFFDFSSDIINDYDDYELEKIPFNPRCFIVLSSSNPKRLEAIIKENVFDRSLYIDNDHGLITSIGAYRKLLLKNRF